ncbi:hypothetical protein HNP12_002411 [Aeromonas hydrophila]|uniref:DUF4145 domain-containing protein n=1 Tax=Aeromonas hydrophila TaxID=644 RepID=UPI002167F64B|nr:DUF4145 domain-containing protein [Aeromonas hydrophila]MCS3768337.1 hypothetical protein [Aeromonas hydrophila]
MVDISGVVKEFKSVPGNTDRHLCVCRVCDKDTFHYIIFSYNEHGRQDCGRGNEVSWQEKNQIIQCLGCDTVSFRTVLTDSESVDYFYDENGNTGVYHCETIKYYPARMEGLNYIDVDKLPLKILDIYKETQFSIENEQYVLAGIGIRAIVETVCKDLKASGKSLSEQINSLKNMSIVTSEGAETLHKLRILGNKAAHEVKAHDSQQLRLAMKIIDHMLDGTYVIPQEVEEVFKSDSPEQE